MKKILVIVGICALLLSFKGSPDPLLLIRENYLSDLSACMSKLDKLEADWKNGSGPEALLEDLTIARHQFRAIEWWLEYADRGLYERWNGAPFPSPDNTYPGIKMDPPSGFQVLEGLLREEEPDNKAVLEQLQQIKNLATASAAVAAQLQRREQVYEAIRFNLVRIETLTLPGFDTPHSGQASADAIAALDALQGTAALMAGTPDKYSAAITAGFDRAIAYLEEETEKADLLYIIKNGLYPIHTALRDWAGHEGLLSVHPLRPVNMAFRTIYDQDFINPYYYGASSPVAQREKVAALGKILFFDPALSEGSKLSCASCHQPEKAFADGLPKSVSNSPGTTLSRNAPTLLNAALQPVLMYDLSANGLENQMDHVVASDLEFHTDYDKMIATLQMSEEYVALFRKAFPSQNNPVNTGTIHTAIAGFVRTLVAPDSPFDQYMRGQTAYLPDAAKKGFNLFMGKAKCGTCHFAPSFYGVVPPFYLESESEVLGVPDIWPADHPDLDEDRGRYQEYNAAEFDHSFKTASVRNVEFTMPYMHNGGMATLDDVLDFYNKGGGAGIGLDISNQTLQSAPLGLTAEEIVQIKAFLHSLTHVPEVSIPERLPAFPASAGIPADRMKGY